jgi:DNA-binding NtrC family response regulator
MAKILLVDDDESILFTSSLALRKRGHEVVIANSGEQALQKLNERQFEFLISDIQMPGINGLELAEKVKEIPDKPHIILISAHYDEKRLPVKLSQAFLQKPLDFDTLNQLLETNTTSNKPHTNRYSAPSHRWVPRRDKPHRKPQP